MISNGQETWAAQAGGKKDFPFILFPPQAPVRGWRPEEVNALIDEIMAPYRVDPDRVYLTGSQHGGHTGTGPLLPPTRQVCRRQFPILRGGILGGRNSNACRSWLFHGAKIHRAPGRPKPWSTRSRPAGGNVKLTILSGMRT